MKKRHQLSECINDWHDIDEKQMDHAREIKRYLDSVKATKKDNKEANKLINGLYDLISKAQERRYKKLSKLETYREKKLDRLQKKRMKANK